MAKAVPDAILDASLDAIALSTILHICSGQPANYAGIAAVSLGSVVLTAGNGNGDFTIANGDTSGRKLTVAAQSGVSVTATGTANHFALASTGDTTLRYVTTCTSQSVTSGNTANIGAWDIEIADPT